MEYEDIIPEGLEGKTDKERMKIIKRWEYLHDLKQAIRDGKMPEDRLPELEKEIARVSEKLAPREPVPVSGFLLKDGKEYVFCPRCGTFVHIMEDRIDELVWEFEGTTEDKPDEEQVTSRYLIRSITCPICKWGLGLPEQ